MLVLTRKRGEQVRIGESILVTVTKMNNSQVTLGIDAPREMKVLRNELAAASLEQLAVLVTGAWLNVFLGVPRKDVNAQRFTWKVAAVGGAFEWEWDELGSWLRLSVINSLNDTPVQVHYWDRATRGEVERICRCLGMKVRGVREAAA